MRNRREKWPSSVLTDAVGVVEPHVVIQRPGKGHLATHLQQLHKSAPSTARQRAEHNTISKQTLLKQTINHRKPAYAQQLVAILNASFAHEAAMTALVDATAGMMFLTTP